MTPEGRLMREIMLAVSKAGARVLRVNAGKGWVGPSVRQADGTVIIRNAQPFHGAPPGTSDLLGWCVDGRFLALEVKTRTGRVSPEQQAFIDAVRRSGGRAGVVRSVGEALDILSAP